MKFNILFLAFSMIVIMGCSKDTPTNNTVTDQDIITATISGSFNTQFNATSFISGTTTKDFINSVGMTSNYSISLFASINGIGSYKMPDKITYTRILVGDLATSEGYEADSGEIIVTTRDSTVIKGTFHCTAVNSKDPSKKINVTNGNFVFYLNK